MNIPTKCGHCDVDLVPRESNELTVRHRAFEALVVTVEGLQVCPSCGEIYTPVDYDDAIDRAYAAALRNRIRPLLVQIKEEQDWRPVRLERIIGLDAGEVRKVVESTDHSPATTKVLASILVVTYLLVVACEDADTTNRSLQDYLLADS